LKEVALRLGFPLERAKLDVLAIGRGQPGWCRWCRETGPISSEKSSDPGFCLRNLLVQIFELDRQPLAGGFGLRRPRVLRQHKVALGNRIGDARRELRVARLEFNDDDGDLSTA